MSAREITNPATPDRWTADLPAAPHNQALGLLEEAPPARLAPLTGRDHEVSLLKDRWEHAQEGMGQVVLLIGEPGLGKSRLVSTIKQYVEQQPVGPASASSGQTAAGAAQDPPVVEWRCSQRFQNTGLYSARDFFERLLGLGRDETPGERFDRLARHLEEYDLAGPNLVALFASFLLLPPDDRFQPLALSPVREREEMFKALRQWLRAYSARRPVLFIVEDLHWVDASTLEFLGQFLAEGLHDRILTVLTFRPEFKTPWPAVAHQTSLALNRLTRRQVGELMRKDAGGPLGEPLVEQIYQRTGGVPLFVEELIKMVQDPGAPGSAGQGDPTVQGRLGREMPATLQDLVIARLDQMTSNREIAQYAATLGREFSHELLAAVAPVEEATLRVELAKLVKAEILYQKGRPPRCTYTFKHALLEDALRDALPEGQRRQFHGRIAEVLEAQFPKVAQTQPELLAHHLTEAHLPEKAVGYRLRAGLRSQERFANVEAIGHLTKGAELLATLDASPQRDALELEFLGPLGTVYIAARGYAAPEVGPVFARARELCARVGQPAQRFAIMWGAWVWHMVRAELPLCTQLAREVVALAEQANDPGMLMEALFPPAVTSAFRGEFAAARDACTRALQLDDRERTRSWAAITGEDSGVAHRCYLSVALWHLGHPDQALKLNQEAVQLARTLGQPFTLAFALEHRAWLCNQCRLASEAAAAAEEEIAIATDQGFAYWLASATLFKIDSMVLQGQSVEALPLLTKGLHDLRATGTGLDVTFHLGFLGSALTQTGRFDEAARALDDSLAIAEKSDERFYEAELHRLRGELHLSATGAQGPAEECFRKAIETARRQQSRAWELRATTSLARLWHQQGRRDEAHAALATIYDTFTEGLATPDLLEARALLETIGNERMRQDIAAGIKYVRGCIPPPMAGAVAVNWRYIPSSTLGGDTIGYHWIDDDHLAIYLIDVTGHGLDSALLSVTITNVLRSGSLPGADMRRPDKVLATLNAAFPGERHGDKYFTIWYAVYRPSTRTLAWSGGGHHPSILLRPGDANAMLLPATGPMMGAIPAMEFPAETCHVAPDARLLVFSDGVFEILRAGRVVWNLHACMEYIAALGAQPQGEIDLMDQVLAHARQLRGANHLEDDFSIIDARFR